MRSLRRSIVVPALALTLAAGCTSPGVEGPRGGDVRAGETFTLGVGDTARLQGTDLTVTLRDVRNDSRCPTDVDCAWAGDATLMVVVADGRSTPASLEMHTTVRRGPAPAGAHVLRLVALDPSRRSGHRLEAEDYRARLRIDPA